jgi:hypothetical protein
MRCRCTGAVRRLVRSLRPHEVPICKCLLGDEGGMPAAKYARIVGNILRPSTPMPDSPHAKLLLDYNALGEGLFAPDRFQDTDYYRNAALAIDIVGHYFDARSPEEVVRVARRLVDRYQGIGSPVVYRGQSPPNQCIRVRSIMHSDCFQVIDGHHRLAIHYARGRKAAPVLIDRAPVLTPLQSILLDVLWLDGRLELYQPIDAPEVQNWPLVRRCSDRMDKIRSFLQDHWDVNTRRHSALDLGSSYGWFVSQFQKLGFDAHGVERDPIAASIGPMLYGVGPDRVFRSDLVRFLEESRRSYNVVTCFSVLHHYALGRQRVPAEALIRLIDKATVNILFLDTGQNHEEWFRDSLPLWDTDFIERWLKTHTSFSRIYRLGADEDAVPPFQKNYSRMLFACVR